MLRIVNAVYSFFQEDEDFEMGATGGWERVVATEKKEKVDQQVCCLRYFSLFFSQKLTGMIRNYLLLEANTPFTLEV